VQRVLIVENQILLGAGVQSLLGDETDLEMRGISPTSQVDLIHEIRQYQPDIVVVNASSHLTVPGKLLFAVDNHSQLRVVVISADDNRVCIYEKHEVFMTRASDLLDIIRDC